MTQCLQHREDLNPTSTPRPAAPAGHEQVEIVPGAPVCVHILMDDQPPAFTDPTVVSHSVPWLTLSSPSGSALLRQLYARPRSHPSFQAPHTLRMAALCPLSLLCPVCPHRVHSTVLLRNYPGPTLSTDSPVSSVKVTTCLAQVRGGVSSLRRGTGRLCLSSTVNV